MQLRKRQASLKSRLSEWKSSEDLAKEVAEEEKPKPVDPGKPFFYFLVVLKVQFFVEVLKMRQARDLEIAKEKLSKKDAMVQKMNEREQKQKEMHVSVLDKEVTRDPNRLLSGTKASEANKLSYDDLDDAERKRTEAGAHGAKVAMNGRDLKFSGRAIPEWRKPTI